MSDEENGTTMESERKAIKTLIVLACIAFAIIIVGSSIIGSYNALVDSDLQVQRAASNIKVDMERRADLLPNLAATLQGSATFEYKTLVDVTRARAGESQKIRADIADTKVSDVNSLASKNEQLTNILGNFVKLQEQYPTLQTTQQFREFSAQVTATENEILADRQTYNAAVMQYQSVVRSSPTNILAGMFGFNAEKYQMYVPANQTRAEEVPVVTFDFSKL